MTAIIAVRYKSKETNSFRTDVWKATEILPAFHQRLTGTGRYVMVQKRDYTGIYDVRWVKDFNLLAWLTDYTKIFFEYEPVEITVISLEA